MDNENTSEINEQEKASLVFSTLTIRTLGFFIFLTLGLNAVIDFRRHWDFEAGIVLVLFSPLISLLTILVAINPRKRGSVKQKNVAKWCMAVGFLGIIISGYLIFLFLTLAT